MNVEMATDSHSDSAMRGMAATVVFVAMLLAALSIWTAIPLSWIYIGSKVSHTQFPSNMPYLVVAVGIVVALVVTMTGLGVFHATRNRIRHAPGSLSGKQLFTQYCDRCHGVDLKGDANFPSVIAREVPLAELTTLLREPKGIMPRFPDLDAIDVQRLCDYLAERRHAAAR